MSLYQTCLMTCPPGCTIIGAVSRSSGRGVALTPPRSVLLFGLAILLGYVYAFVASTDAANAIATSVGTRVL